MNKYAHIMAKNMSSKDLFEAGFIKKPRVYDVVKVFSPHAFVGSGGANDVQFDNRGLVKDKQLLERFYRRFPMLKLMPQTTYTKMDWGDNGPRLQHPCSNFLKRYKTLSKKGYSEDKAFNMVEGELEEAMENQRDEMRILRGAALSDHGNSYLDRAQKVAELESTLKMKRFTRDIAKFERTANAQSWLDDNEVDDGDRDTVEDLLYNEKIGPSFEGLKPGKYEPVLYQIVKEPSQLSQKDSLHQD